MQFTLLNIIVLLCCIFIYFHFRSGVDAYCRISKMSKTYIRKNTKGASNFWFYSQIHKQENLGILYYLNLIYLFLLTIFLVAFSLSWVSFLKIPVIIMGLLLSTVAIPIFAISLYYTNICDVGKAFFVFRYFNGYNEKRRGISTMFDWLIGLIPLALYIFFLTN